MLELLKIGQNSEIGGFGRGSIRIKIIISYLIIDVLLESNDMMLKKTLYTVASIKINIMTSFPKFNCHIARVFPSYLGRIERTTPAMCQIISNQNLIQFCIYTAC